MTIARTALWRTVTLAAALSAAHELLVEENPRASVVFVSVYTLCFLVALDRRPRRQHPQTDDNEPSFQQLRAEALAELDAADPTLIDPDKILEPEADPPPPDDRRHLLPAPRERAQPNSRVRPAREPRHEATSWCHHCRELRWGHRPCHANPQTCPTTTDPRTHLRAILDEAGTIIEGQQPTPAQRQRYIDLMREAKGLAHDIRIETSRGELLAAIERNDKQIELAYGIPQHQTGRTTCTSETSPASEPSPTTSTPPTT